MLVYMVLLRGFLFFPRLQKTQRKSQNEGVLAGSRQLDLPEVFHRQSQTGAICDEVDDPNALVQSDLIATVTLSGAAP